MADDHGGDRDEAGSSDAAGSDPDDRDDATESEAPDTPEDDERTDDTTDESDAGDDATEDDASGESGDENGTDDDEYDIITPGDVDTPSIGRSPDDADGDSEADADDSEADDGEDTGDDENGTDDGEETDDAEPPTGEEPRHAQPTAPGTESRESGPEDPDYAQPDGVEAGRDRSGDHGDPTAETAQHGRAAGEPGRADGGANAMAYEPQEVPTGGGVSAPDDEEMPLAAHIEEMVIRLAWVIGALVVVAAVSFPVADRLINFLWYSFLPGSVSACPPPPEAKLRSISSACPFVYHPLALMFARIKMAGLVGFVAALPVLVYQSYLFMRPGLYPRERRYYLASVPTSLILASVGMAFAYFLVLPTLFAYFTEYSEAAADIAFGLTETFNLIVMMLGFFALIFQIPLFIMLAVMMGVASRRWLARRRIYFWGGFATIAFVFSPDPTGMAPILVAVTMIILFEGTLLLLYWTGEASTFATPEALAARRPFAWLVAALAGYLSSTAPLPDTYYDQLPSAFTSTVADFASARLTPLVIGGALIVVYEVLLYAHRRVRGRDRLARILARARVFVWPVSLLVGYFGSPDPVLLRRVDAVDLATPEAAGLAVGLIVAYELLIVARRWLANRRLW